VDTRSLLWNGNEVNRWRRKLPSPIPGQFVKNHFFVEANSNFNLLNMAIAVGMDEINPSGSKLAHKHEYAYSRAHFAPCNLERNIG